MINQKIKCYLVSVNCQENDMVDIKAGGPKYLGYDFYIESTKINQMRKYIEETLKEYNVPVLSLFVGNDIKLIESKKVSTKESIKIAISENEACITY